MPADHFLTEEQAAVFGRFVGEPSRAELEQFFYLDAADLERIAEHRGGHNRLGFALQVGTTRFLGTFLSDPREQLHSQLHHCLPPLEKHSDEVNGGVGSSQTAIHQPASRETARGGLKSKCKNGLNSKCHIQPLNVRSQSAWHPSNARWARWTLSKRTLTRLR